MISEHTDFFIVTIYHDLLKFLFVTTVKNLFNVWSVDTYLSVMV